MQHSSDTTIDDARRSRLHELYKEGEWYTGVLQRHVKNSYGFIYSYEYANAFGDDDRGIYFTWRNLHFSTDERVLLKNSITPLDYMIKFKPNGDIVASHVNVRHNESPSAIPAPDPALPQAPAATPYAHHAPPSPTKQPPLPVLRPLAPLVPHATSTVTPYGYSPTQVVMAPPPGTFDLCAPVSVLVDVIAQQGAWSPDKRAEVLRTLSNIDCDTVELVVEYWEEVVEAFADRPRLLSQFETVMAQLGLRSASPARPSLAPKPAPSAFAASSLAPVPTVPTSAVPLASLAQNRPSAAATAPLTYVPTAKLAREAPPITREQLEHLFAGAPGSDAFKPELFCDPVSGEVFREPVMLSNGNVFDLSTLQSHFEKNPTTTDDPLGVMFMRDRQTQRPLFFSDHRLLMLIKMFSAMYRESQLRQSEV